MVAVAMVNLTAMCSLLIRAISLENQADEHHFEWTMIELGSDSDGSPAQAEYHRAMEIKYRCAARRPWLPVVPDPPAPERP
jgi:hypothetical protein